MSLARLHEFNVKTVAYSFDYGKEYVDKGRQKHCHRTSSKFLSKLLLFTFRLYLKI